MSTRFPLRRYPARSTARRAKSTGGFTLIELMVAMVLGLIVVSGVVSVFLANQRTYRTNQALGDVQDGSRIAFELMARDIRDAGLTGCGNAGRVANVVNPSGASWWNDWSNAVHGYGAGTASADPALTVGTVATSQVSGTDSLQLLGAADTGLSVAATPSSTAANFKLNDTTSDLVTGDVIIVCDPDHATIVQITNYTSSNVTVVHNTGAGSPGNCSKGMGYPTVCTPNGNGYQFGPNSQIFKLAAVDWYIGVNPVGGRSLYRVNVATTGGVPTAAAQEMVRDVTAMDIRYHQAGVASFADAKTIGTNWATVDAVQVKLTLESVDKRAGVDVKPITRNFTATTTVRNRVQ
jgi:type IV pilus assembly protein PilW